MAGRTIDQVKASVRGAPSWAATQALITSSAEAFDAAQQAAHGEDAVKYQDEVRAVVAKLGDEVGADIKELAAVFLGIQETAHADAEHALRLGLQRAMNARPQAEKSDQGRTIARLVTDQPDIGYLRTLLENFATDGPGMRKQTSAAPQAISHPAATLAQEGAAQAGAVAQPAPVENSITPAAPATTTAAAVENSIAPAAPQASAEAATAAPQTTAPAQKRPASKQKKEPGKAAFILRKGDEVRFYDHESKAELPNYSGVAMDTTGGLAQYFGVNRDNKGEAELVPLTKEEAEAALAKAQTKGFVAKVAAQETSVGEIASGDKTAETPPKKHDGASVVVLAGLQLARDEQNNYRRIGEDMVAMTDKGGSIKINESNVDLVKAGLALALEKGWTEIEIKGSKDFCSTMWVEATLMGLKTKGYQPTEQDVLAVHAARNQPVNAEEKAASHKELVDRCLEKNVGTTDAAQNNKGPQSFRGEVMDESTHHFAQNLGKGHWAIHEKYPESPVKVGQKVEVRYTDGVQVGVIDTGKKAKEKAATHER